MSLGFGLSIKQNKTFDNVSLKSKKINYMYKLFSEANIQEIYDL